MHRVSLLSTKRTFRRCRAFRQAMLEESMLPAVLRLSDSLLAAAISARVVSTAAELTAAVQRQISIDDISQVCASPLTRC